MKCRILIVLVFLLLTATSFKRVMAVGTSDCPSDTTCTNETEISKKIKCLEDQVSNCKKNIDSLSSQINYLNSQIKLNELNIKQTTQKIGDLETEIASISAKIDKLELSLSTVINVLISRIIATYKIGTGEYISLILSSNGFSDFLIRAKYIRSVQEHDKKLLFQMQETKNNYVDQKLERENKKKELDSLKITLAQQKASLDGTKKQKESFLNITKNNNTKFQQMLAEARREAEEIQRAASLISTSGEKKAVKKGDPVGLMGNTGWSTGAHLHFAVYNLKEAELSSFNFESSYDNPFNYLSSQNTRFDATSCDDVGGDTDKNIGGGGWSWPMNSPHISQCYGHTPWSWRYATGSHNGVDIYNNDDIVIHAVDDGDAFIYRGGQANGNGVFIFHNNGKMSLYWHLQ